MFSAKELPSPSSMLSPYASIPAAFRSLRGCLSSTFCYFFKPGSRQLTLVFDEFNGMTKNQIYLPCPNGMTRNQIYDAAEVYLCTKIGPDTKRLQISKIPQKNLTIRLEKGEKVVDVYDGIKLKWTFVGREAEKNPPFPSPGKRSFELSFHKKHKEFVLNSYLPFLLDRAEEIKDEQKVLKMFTLNSPFTLKNPQSYGGIKWKSINLEPANFETLAMEPDLKNAVIEDLNRFVKRKEFYKRAGRGWKRGYLLYGPPATGKSSLVAAMANYLKFDVYDLQLANIMSDFDLRRSLLETKNRSILLIEDIDRSVDPPDQGHVDDDDDDDDFGCDCGCDCDVCTQPTVKAKAKANAKAKVKVKLTLSGVLDLIDSLWSSCEDERIIILTTNQKDRLDPALLRPGRMDMHIHMSYCTTQGFKHLASNYLDIKGHHRLFGEIEGLLKNTEVTPAQIAEELMKSGDADIALEGVVKLLKRKKLEAEIDDEAASKQA